MTDVVNNPDNGDSGSGVGIIVGIVIIIAILILLVMFGLPYLRGGTVNSLDGLPEDNAPSDNSDFEVTVPDEDVSLPDQFDVNVNP